MLLMLLFVGRVDELDASLHLVTTSYEALQQQVNQQVR